MGWTLVVSEEDWFQRAAIRCARDDERVVGATGVLSACSLVSSIAVDRIIVDSTSECGREFLCVVRNLPAGTVPPVVAVGPVMPLCRCTADVNGAFTELRRADAA